MGKLGTGELIIILVIALVVFGPSKLPEIGRSIGESIREFKKQANKVTEDDTAEKEEDNSTT